MQNQRGLDPQQVETRASWDSSNKFNTNWVFAWDRLAIEIDQKVGLQFHVFSLQLPGKRMSMLTQRHGNFYNLYR